jgi:hypothetical protein
MIHKEDIAWGGIFILVIAGVIGYGIWIRVHNNTTKLIDGCQYIQHYNGHGWDLVHKGNCTNVIHYHK